MNSWPTSIIKVWISTA